MEDGGLLILQLLFLLFLIALNAFFASSEVALISLKPATVRRLGSEGGSRGRRLAALVENSGRFLATVQVGVTFAGFMASAFAAESFSDPVTLWLEQHGFTLLSHATLDALVVLAITVLLSYVSLVFGELLPKQLGLRYAEGIALHVAGPIDFLAKITAPFVWVLNASVNFFLKLFGIQPSSEQEVTEEEIRMMVDIGEENGAIESDEKRMIENVFEFNNTTAGEVMTHRTEAVYKGDIDKIVGLLHFRDYFTAKLNGNAAPDIKGLLKPVYFAPETMRANRLFRDLQSKKLGMAIILDEFSGTSGIVTLEDLLEEIVGSLYDEYDDYSEEAEEIGEKLWRIDGSMRIDEVSRLIDRPLPNEEEEYDTIGGLIFGRLNAIPTPGATITLPEAGIELKVEAVDGRRVDKVQLKLLPEPEETDSCE